ncbi:MAG: caspase family protein [Candidatus Cloacimonadaceae bacterium]|nr:caspase family protein [Candidatus Cloacimonadaceae bacterium]
MKRTITIICLGIICGVLWADLSFETLTLSGWIKTPFSSTALEAERAYRISEYQNLVKGEFETIAQFEQRKKDVNARVAAITREYEQKINDARAAHNAYIAKLDLRMRQILNQSRETIQMKGTLGAYDSETQKFKVSIPGKTFDVVVPLDKAPGVKQNFAKYSLSVTRQLNQNMGWDYLEAKLSGEAGTFASTDKAPALGGSTTIISIIPPRLEAIISFSEPGGNNMLDAEETATLTININNSGKGSANMVEAIFNLTGSSAVSYPGSLYFGEVKAGQTVSQSITLKGESGLTDTQVELRISFREQNGFPPDDKPLKFSTKALLAPDIYIADSGIADQSKNGKIEPGEQVEVRARIHNRGQGIAKGVSAEVNLGELTYFMQGSGALHNLGDIPSGGYKDIVFDIISAKTATKLEIKINLNEARGRFSNLNQPLNLAFNRAEKTAEAMIITGKHSQAQIRAAPSLSIDIEQGIPTFGKANKNRWGVVIGIENYRNASSVRFARRDAEFMKEYFNKVLGIPMANIYEKLDEHATSGTLREIFDPRGWLDKNASHKDCEIFIYYSGHGAPDINSKKAYLLPYDGNPDYASISGYDLETLYANLQNLKAKQITLFLDSCFSGANRENEIILAGARPVSIKTETPKAAGNLSVFAASSGSEIASSYSDKLHGLFSYFLMKGMRGDADINMDNKITLQELNEYLIENVPATARRMGREQNPQLMSGEPGRVLIQW